jgi:23S rRNA (guanosine2251-2'-O)-methyltransferase
MSGQKKGGDSGKAPGGGYTKRGKPRPGTGGYKRDRLEGKGPTPPARLRPGHPANRAAAKAAKGAGPLPSSRSRL